MAGILTGTPIPTGGVHPFTSIMGQGIDVLQNGFRMAAGRQSQGEQMTMNFIRDAMQERIAKERMALEQRQADRSYELQVQALRQRERMQQSELAARERMAASRASAIGSRRASMGAARPDISGALNGLLSSSFANAGGGQQPPAPEAAPEDNFAQVYGQTRNNIMTPDDGGAQGTGQGDVVGYEQISRPAAEADSAVTEAYDRDLSQPENVDSLEQALQRKQLIYMAGVQASPTIAGQLSYAGRAAEAAVEIEKYRKERTKEGSDLNGLAVIDKAVAGRLSPFDGFTGKKFSTEQDLEGAMQDPETARALSLLNTGSAQLRKDLVRGDPSIEQLSTLLDKYQMAESSLNEQEKEASFLAVSGSPAGARVDARHLVKSRFDSSPLVSKIRGHKEVIQDVFDQRIKDEDLSKLTPRQLEQANLTVRRSLASAEGRLKETAEQEQALDSRIGTLINNQSWGLQQLDEEIDRERDEKGFLSARGETLKTEKERYLQTREAREKADRSFRAAQGQLSAVSQASGLEDASMQNDPMDPDAEGEAFWDQPRKGSEFQSQPQEPGGILKGEINNAFDQFEQKRKAREAALKGSFGPR